MSRRIPFLTAQWRQLAMLNFEVPPELLSPYVPAGVTLDSYRERTLVSLVGFLFQRTRLKGWLIPLHTNFEEVNLRFYVRRVTKEGVKRGVVFIREIVPRRAIAVIARKIYNEPYIAMPMRHSVDHGRLTQYAWRHNGRWNSLQVAPCGAEHNSEPGSEEEFITEHYWGYSRQRNGSTMEYEVEHPKWRVTKGRSTVLDCDVAALYGKQFHEHIKGEPSSAFLAEGSEVTVYEGRPLA